MAKLDFMISNTFSESQRFNARWMLIIYLILFLIFGLLVYGSIQQIYLNRPFGTKPAPNSVLILFIIFISLLICMFYFIRLKTKINEVGVFFKWTIFQRTFKKFEWKDIKSVDIFKYGFVGYGLRFSSQGIIHNTRGNMGLRIILKSNRTIILGTQKAEELQKFLSEMKSFN